LLMLLNSCTKGQKKPTWDSGMGLGRDQLGRPDHPRIVATAQGVVEDGRKDRTGRRRMKRTARRRPREGAGNLRPAWRHGGGWVVDLARCARIKSRPGADDDHAKARPRRTSAGRSYLMDFFYYFNLFNKYLRNEADLFFL
jgi:hypothetical protein